MKLRCVFLGHDRDRRRVYGKGLFWRTTCTRCGARLVKPGDADKWRRASAKEANDGGWP